MRLLGMIMGVGLCIACALLLLAGCGVIVIALAFGY